MIIQMSAIFKIIGIIAAVVVVGYIFIVGFKENSKMHGDNGKKSGSSSSGSSAPTQTTEKKD